MGTVGRSACMHASGAFDVQCSISSVDPGLGCSSGEDQVVLSHIGCSTALLGLVTCPPLTKRRARSVSCLLWVRPYGSLSDKGVREAHLLAEDGWRFC